MRASRRRCRRSSRSAGISRVSRSRDRRSGPLQAATRSFGPGSRSELEAQAGQDAAAARLDLLILGPGGRAQVFVLEVQADVLAEADIGARHALEREAGCLPSEVAAEARARVTEPDAEEGVEPGCCLDVVLRVEDPDEGRHVPL